MAAQKTHKVKWFFKTNKVRSQDAQMGAHQKTHRDWEYEQQRGTRIKNSWRQNTNTGWSEHGLKGQHHIIQNRIPWTGRDAKMLPDTKEASVLTLFLPEELANSLELLKQCSSPTSLSNMEEKDLWI